MAAVTPQRYRLTLEPNLAARRFAGRVVIDVSGTADTVTLDCVDLDILSIESGGIAAPWTLADGRLTVQAAVAGEASIAIAYTGPIGEAPRGLYSDGDWLLSQMQPTHARRVFPCFDHPAHRCPFELSVRINNTGVTIPVVRGVPPVFPRDAFANAALRAADGDWRHFESTPPLPTNLLALAVTHSLSRETLVGDIPIGMHGMPHPAALEFARAAAARALAFNVDWHGRPPPIGKLDLVAVQRLEAAGMENIGAIFLRDQVVMVFEPDDPPQRLRDIAELVAHEVAHQWFGGIVSPASWKDLWLNEGFATWMAAKTLRADGADPAYKASLVRATRAAMAVDHKPLRRDAVTEAEIAERFDIAAYRKGAAILTLLEAWLSEKVFQAGVRRYVAKGGTVTAEDLWAALEAESGQPVALVAAPLAERAGVPTLGFSRDGDDLVIRQLGEPRVMPVFVKTAAGVQTLLLTTVEARLPVEGWAFGNAGARGYYRCQHDFEVPLEGLDEAELVALQEDAWDGLWSGAGELVAYLALAGRLLAAGRGLDTLGPRLDELADLLASGLRRAPFDAWRAAAPAGPLTELEARWAELSGEDQASRTTGRAAFRQAQQGRFDAWLLHQSAQPGPVGDALRAEHATINPLAAALHGALYLRSAFDAEGLAAPPWMQAANDLRGVLAAVERVAAQQARGLPCAPASLGDLVRRMGEDLTAAAALADQQLGKLQGTDPAAPRLIALLMGREAAAREREYEGQRTFAALFDEPAPVPPEDAQTARTWLARTAGKPLWRGERLALRNDAALTGARLWARAARLAGTDNLWAAYGAADPAPWLARGVTDPVEAGGWALRGFKPGQVVEGADPRALRSAPVSPASPVKPLRLVLPDGSVLKAEFPPDPALRAQGLMHRDRLGRDEAMLFELPDEGPHPFFMRGVRMALDLLWLDGEGRIGHIEAQAEPWSAAALPGDLSLAVGRYVLEMAGGEAARRGLKVGDRVEGLP
jgi:puromycin-sensitive aminopeptidase